MGAGEFEAEYAAHLSREKPLRGDTWHLEEVVISIAGTKHWLGGAILLLMGIAAKNSILLVEYTILGQIWNSSSARMR